MLSNTVQKIAITSNEAQQDRMLSSKVQLNEGQWDRMLSNKVQRLQ